MKEKQKLRYPIVAAQNRIERAINRCVFLIDTIFDCIYKLIIFDSQIDLN